MTTLDGGWPKVRGEETAGRATMAVWVDGARLTPRWFGSGTDRQLGATIDHHRFANQLGDGVGGPPSVLIAGDLHEL